jgi:hypothetical protein
MFQLGKTIVSEDVLVKEFVCNLSACHGACCIDGDAGAPLSKEETEILEKYIQKLNLFYDQKVLRQLKKKELGLLEPIKI